MLQYYHGRILAFPLQEFGKQCVWADGAVIQRYRTHTEKCEHRQALQLVWEIVTQANQYIDRMKPWELAKAGQDWQRRLELALVLRNLVAALRLIAVMLLPYLPNAAARIYGCFKFQLDWEFLELIRSPQLSNLGYNNHVGLQNGVAVNFDRLEKPKKATNCLLCFLASRGRSTMVVRRRRR